MMRARICLGVPLIPALCVAFHSLRRRRAHVATRLFGLVAFVFALLTAAAVQAHPHVWATMTTELLYAPDGSMTGVRQAWTFDDMYSAFATTGIKARTKGQFTRQELQPLAQVNVESLKDFDYFTYAKIDGKRQKNVFSEPVDYWLDYDPKATVLTLHFTLPFKKPVTAKKLHNRNLRSGIFRRFRLCRQQSGQTRRCTAAMHGDD